MYNPKIQSSRPTKNVRPAARQGGHLVFKKLRQADWCPLNMLWMAATKPRAISSNLHGRGDYFHYTWVFPFSAEYWIME
jgi:hypothetical protein